MLRAALLLPLLFVALLASACARTPTVRVEARRLDGPRPPQLLLRCRVDGAKGLIKYQWRFSAGVKQIGWSVPSDEATALVQPAEPAAGWAECAATIDDKLTLRAAHSLAPLTIATAPPTAKAGELVTVRGGGFGPLPGDGDGIWLVPRRGAALPADHACKGATWNETVMSACVPASARGAAWQLRVQVGAELALAPKPLTVAP